jgi:hypothetical protein
MLIGGICGWREQMRLWIFLLGAFVRSCTDIEMMRARMAMSGMAEALVLELMVGKIPLVVFVAAIF